MVNADFPIKYKRVTKKIINKSDNLPGCKIVDGEGLNWGKKFLVCSPKNSKRPVIKEIK